MIVPCRVCGEIAVSRPGMFCLGHSLAWEASAEHLRSVYWATWESRPGVRDGLPRSDAALVDFISAQVAIRRNDLAAKVIEAAKAGAHGDAVIR
jgi:hypothetical protein